jgi:hypothetical protein
MTGIKFDIARIIVRLDIDPACGRINIADTRLKYPSFLYSGTRSAAIRLKVAPLTSLPAKVNKASRKLFTTIHPLRNQTAWTISEAKGRYILNQRLSAKKKIMFLNKDYREGEIYIDTGSALVIDLQDLLYDCIQIAVIGYLAENRGIVVHSAGVKTGVRRGFIFSGASGRGKSTIARIWKDSKLGRVLNDDRIILRRIKNKLLIFGSPWHGNFSDYSDSITECAELGKVFFIYHGKKNAACKLGAQEVFKLMVFNIFPAFWNRKELARQIEFCRQVAAVASAYRLEFVKDSSVVDFVFSVK